jgi:hypothetical protein
MMNVKETIQYIFDKTEIVCDIEIVSLTIHQPSRRMDIEARVVRKVIFPDMPK